MTNPFRPFQQSLELRTNDATGKVVFVDDFFSAQECDQVIALAQSHQEHLGRTGQEGKTDTARDSRVRFVWPAADNAWLFSKLEMAAMALNKNYDYDLLGFYEGVQVARYEVGHHYDWHVDLGTARQSARKISLSVQLSDDADYDGGDIEFLGPTEARAPRTRGALIAFPSFVAHKVHPVTRGERRSLVSWISGKPFR